MTWGGRVIPSEEVHGEFLMNEKASSEKMQIQKQCFQMKHNMWGIVALLADSSLLLWLSGGREPSLPLSHGT